MEAMKASSHSVWSRSLRALWLLLAAVLAAASPAAHALRIKEVAAVQGVRSNQLTGYGLVVGLDGTGDQTTQMPYTTQAMSNYLQQMGITLPPGTASQLQLKNVAAVIVTAQLPAFAQPGQMLDVNVSSMGNSKSLKGGTLITTPLRGADGEVYALAQGNLVVGGAGAAAGGSKVQINHLAAGRIPQGAQVERTVPTPLHDSDTINLGLNASDFQTARKVARPLPSLALMACATLRAVWKSEAFRPRLMVSPSLSGVGTERSTCAPWGTRPAERWLICTLLPPAAAPAPPTTTLPWASA